MRKTAFILSIMALVTTVSCSAKIPTTAIIRVTHGDPPQASTDENDVAIEQEVFTSHLYGQHIDEKLGLSKLWRTSQNEVVNRLRKAITVKAGNEPGLFIISCDGLEHSITVKILNELCAFAIERQTGETRNNGKPQKVVVTIVEPAK